MIGRTPLLRIGRLAKDHKIFAKCEFMNPISIKDRPVLAIIEEAERSGRLRPGSTLIEATSGNTGMADGPTPRTISGWSERRVGVVAGVVCGVCRCGARRFRARRAAVSPGKFYFFTPTEEPVVATETWLVGRRRASHSYTRGTCRRLYDTKCSLPLEPCLLANALCLPRSSPSISTVMPRPCSS